MASSDIIENPPKGLTFDVFGTCVNWRTTVVDTLKTCAKASSYNELSPSLRSRLSQLQDKDWEQFAQEWRSTYGKFTKGFNPEEDEWRDIDTHNYLSLIQLLKKWDLENLYSEEEILELSRIWHFLDPWKDSSAGMKKLSTKFVTSSLSNGNRKLQADLTKHAQLDFTMLQSAEDFKAYKPHPSVYRGAVKKVLGGVAGADLDMSEVAMVAAHLNDLKAARSLGMRTIYVERWQEEDKEAPEYEDAKTWVDMWVSEEEDGFLEVASRFGIE